jgi:hypothetical protein
MTDREAKASFRGFSGQYRMNQNGPSAAERIVGIIVGVLGIVGAVIFAAWTRS